MGINKKINPSHEQSLFEIEMILKRIRVNLLMIVRIICVIQ